MKNLYYRESTRIMKNLSYRKNTRIMKNLSYRKSIRIMKNYPIYYTWHPSILQKEQTNYISHNYVLVLYVHLSSTLRNNNNVAFILRDKMQEHTQWRTSLKQLIQNWIDVFNIPLNLGKWQRVIMKVFRKGISSWTCWKAVVAASKLFRSCAWNEKHSRDGRAQGSAWWKWRHA